MGTGNILIRLREAQADLRIPCSSMPYGNFSHDAMQIMSGQSFTEVNLTGGFRHLILFVFAVL